MFALARSVLFKMYESPRFLVANGRANEAVVVLRNIATYNDHTINIDHDDVRPQAADASGVLDEERALMGSSAPMSPVSRSPRRRSSGNLSSSGSHAAGPLAWWHGWVRQMGKLFSPKWRRTVVLVWIIWAAMAFGEK
jgi:hypothetical protein